jgi:hypothetical protein
VTVQSVFYCDWLGSDLRMISWFSFLLWMPATMSNCPGSPSPSHVATDGQSVSKSWCRAPSGAHDQIFITVWNVRSCFVGRPLFLLHMLLALASAVFLWSESTGARDHILLSQIWDFPFRHLLRLAGSRWRYSTPPPHGVAPVLIWTAAYRALCYPRRWLLLARIHGEASWFHINKLVSKSLQRSFPYQWTRLTPSNGLCPRIVFPLKVVCQSVA